MTLTDHLPEVSPIDADKLRFEDADIEARKILSYFDLKPVSLWVQSLGGSMVYGQTRTGPAQGYLVVEPEVVEVISIGDWVIFHKAEQRFSRLDFQAFKAKYQQPLPYRPAHPLVHPKASDLLAEYRLLDTRVDDRASWKRPPTLVSRDWIYTDKPRLDVGLCPRGEGGISIWTSGGGSWHGQGTYFGDEEVLFLSLR